MILWQFALHGWFAVRGGDPAMAVAHATAWLADVLLLGGLAASVAMAQRHLPAGPARAVDRLGATVLLLLGAGFALYPQLLRAYLQFPVNVLSTDRRTIGVLINEYLGFSRLWPAVASSAIGLAAARLPVRPRRSRWTQLAFGLVVLAGLISLPRSPHPLVHSIGVQFRRAGERVVPSLLVPLRTGAGSIATSLAPALDGPLRADHLFLIVLEGVPSAAFEREFLDAPGGFHAAHRDHAAYYPNYHATNLDSYTSLIAMLTGVQVPYRAYADERLFTAVNEAPSLVQAIRDRGAHATFIGTYEHQPFVPVRRQWDDVLDRTNIAGLDRWVSLGTSRMEAASEDCAALATILQAAAAHPRTFILQEMVYGHSTEWRAKTGLGQLAYYDRYLRELFDGLRQRGLDSRSLIIVVSDHGDRALSAVADNYRVPLLIVGSEVVPGHRGVFLSHQDLSAVISAELTGTPAPPARVGQLVVGSTERWVYGRIDANGASLFIDDRTGSVLASAGAVDAAAVFSEFQDLVSAFASRFGPVKP